MEGSADDLGAPDSWELADLDDSMRRLMVAPRKSSDSLNRPSYSAPEFADEASASGSGDRSGGVSDDVLNQVDQFLREALEKPRERLSILRMEQDIEKFIRDPIQQQLEFQDLPTSYLRLAAHRVAQHYYLQSIAMPENILPDGSGSRIVLRKTSYCKLPPVRLADIPVNLPQEDVSSAVKVAIKKRPQKKSQNMNSSNTHSSKSSHVKSVEERKEEYNRARARIFSSSSGDESGSKAEGESTLHDSFRRCSLVPAQLDEESFVEEREISLPRGLSDSSIGSNESSTRNRTEQELLVSRYKASNRVAIFRDRDVDRKDPDYDRNYDRYMQRFDPGFGFSGGPYTMQPMYSPTVNYNTEFPQLGSSHRPQISVDHQPRSIPQHLHGPWPAASAPPAIGYGPREGMLPPFNPSHVGAHPTSSIYVHSSQYPAPPRPGMQFIHSHELIQPYPQTHLQQSEPNFGLARPR